MQVLAIFKGMGACEKPGHRALRDYRLGNSEWFCVDMLTAVEATQETEPQTSKPKRYSLEQMAWRNKVLGKAIRSTRYPHLNGSA